MPELESRRFCGTITDTSGNVIGEARLWGAGERGASGSWGGWVYASDLGGRPAPGRYTVTTPEGWQATFAIGGEPSTRVFETELCPFTGIGPVPWPPAEDGMATGVPGSLLPHLFCDVDRDWGARLS